jgi:hypothetical protein
VAASAPGGRVKLRRALLAALSLACALHAPALAQDAPPDVPAGEARIVGRVLQGDANRPVPGVEVVLYSLAPDGTPGVRRTQSGAGGEFAFEKVSSTANVAYLVGARHQGIPVPGGRVVFAPGQTSASADIRVADLTRDMSGVRIREHTLRLYREADGLRVEETFAIEQQGAAIAYVPAAERARGKPGLHAQLPRGARDFRMPLGVIPEGLARDESAVRYYGPFYPGMQDLVWAYRLAGGEPSADGMRFTFEVAPAPGAESFAVLVPEGFTGLEAAGLTAQGSFDDGGRRVTRYAAARPAARYALALSAPVARVDPNAVVVHEVQIVLNADDAAIDVNETHVLAVGGDGLVLGTPQSPLLRVPIPANASDIRFGSDARGLEFAENPDGGVDVLGSASPGEIPVQVAYRVPVAEGDARLARRFGTKVALLRVYLADTGRLVPSSPRMHRSRPVRTDDLNYLALEAFDVAAGEEVALALEPLPPRRTASPRAVRTIAALAAVAVVAWLFAPVALRGGAAASVAQPPEDPEHGERAALYQAIRDLDHDFETGKVSADDHAQLGADLRARAAVLLRAEESEGVLREPMGSDPNGSLAASERVCASCRAPAAPEHRFCPSCGAPLGASAA